MNNCTDCKYALWKRTAADSLHPRGEGVCTYAYKVPELPVSMYWNFTPVPRGGHINRRENHPDSCVYFARSEA